MDVTTVTNLFPHLAGHQLELVGYTLILYFAVLIGYLIANMEVKKMRKFQLSKARIGGKIFHNNYGAGEIASIQRGSTPTITVYFPTSNRYRVFNCKEVKK